MKKAAPAFWVSNICNRNVTLTDLALTIPAFTSVNLLDGRHYRYTLEQLQKSVSHGSIFKKNDKIKVRQGAPTVLKPNVPMLQETYLPSRERSTFSIKEEHYEELQVSDEEYIQESTESPDNTSK